MAQILSLLSKNSQDPCLEDYERTALQGLQTFVDLAVENQKQSRKVEKRNDRYVVQIFK
jgi:hypothetical protein